MYMEFRVIITNNENLETTNRRTAMILQCNTNTHDAHSHVRQLLITETWGNAEKKKIQRGKNTTYPKTGGSLRGRNLTCFPLHFFFLLLCLFSVSPTLM